MSKLFPTQEIGSLKKPADMLKKVKDPNVCFEPSFDEVINNLWFVVGTNPQLLNVLPIV